MFREIATGLFALSVLAGAAIAGHGVSLIGRPVPEVMVEKWALPEGTPAPRLLDYKGKVIALLMFQVACPSCHSAGFPLFQDLERQLGANSDLVTLYIQTPFELFMLNSFGAGQATVQKYGVKGLFAQDRLVPGSVTPATFSRFRADGTPWVVFVDRSGVVRFAGYPEPRPGMVEQVRKLLAEKR